MNDIAHATEPAGTCNGQMPATLLEARPFHPAADIFPMLDETNLVELAADIRENGLREPIVLHPDGTILDGRNRYLACKRAGVEPTFRTWAGDGSPIGYVVSLNLHRRHLSESQRALVAAKIANMRQGERTDLASNEATSQSEAAQLMNVSRASVQRARKVFDRGKPELVQAVERGEMAVSKAAKLIDTEPAGQNEVSESDETEAQSIRNQKETTRARVRYAVPRKIRRRLTACIKKAHEARSPSKNAFAELRELEDELREIRDTRLEEGE